MPNRQPGGPGFSFLWRYPSLSHGFQLLKGAGDSPFAIVTQLHLYYQGYQTWGVTYNLLQSLLEMVGISLHF